MQVYHVVEMTKKNLRVFYIFLSGQIWRNCKYNSSLYSKARYLFGRTM